MSEPSMLHELQASFLNPTTTVGAIAYGLLFFALAWSASALLRAWTRRLSVHPRLFVDKTSATFVGQLLRIGCFLIAAVFYAHLVPTLSHLGTALLASAGVLSLIVGLAAQNTLGQMIAGFAILFYRPFEIDDVLTVLMSSGREETGTVKRFTLGYTGLQRADGRWIVIPNSVMLSTIVINAAASHGGREDEGVPKRPDVAVNP